MRNEKIKTREWRDQLETVLSLNFDIQEDKCFSRRVKEMVGKMNDPLNPFLAVRMYGVRYIVNGCEGLTKAETMGIF